MKYKKLSESNSKGKERAPRRSGEPKKKIENMAKRATARPFNFYSVRLRVTEDNFLGAFFMIVAPSNMCITTHPNGCPYPCILYRGNAVRGHVR